MANLQSTSVETYLRVNGFNVYTLNDISSFIGISNNDYKLLADLYSLSSDLLFKNSMLQLNMFGGFYDSFGDVSKTSEAGGSTLSTSILDGRYSFRQWTSSGTFRSIFNNLGNITNATALISIDYSLDPDVSSIQVHLEDGANSIMIQEDVFTDISTLNTANLRIRIDVNTPNSQPVTIFSYGVYIK